MLEIIEKSYPINTTAARLAEDITPLWDWYRIETSETSIKFYAHETVYIEIVKEKESNSPYLRVVSNGTTLTETTDTHLTASRYLYVHIAKTNKGVVIQSAIAPTSTTKVPLTNDIIIISNATNHYAGTMTSVISVIKNPSNSTATNTNNTYICSPEINNKEIVYTQCAFFKKNANKIILLPFFSDVSQCTLNDVYLCFTQMTTELYRGECTLSGRKAYMNGWLLIPCE